MNDYLPRRDSEICLWMEHFSQVCSAERKVLDLSDEQVEEINKLSAEANSELLALANAKAELQAAITRKDLAIQAAAKKIREHAQQFRFDVTVKGSTLRRLGLAQAIPKPSKGILNPPARLVANADATESSVLLKWNRNGCTQGTNFIIEHCINGGPWKMITATTRTRFTVQNVIPGLPHMYRIIAHRRRKQTGPSNVACVYHNGIGAPQLAA